MFRLTKLKTLLAAARLGRQPATTMSPPRKKTFAEKKLCAAQNVELAKYLEIMENIKPALAKVNNMSLRDGVQVLLYSFGRLQWINAKLVPEVERQRNKLLRDAKDRQDAANFAE